MFPIISSNLVIMLNGWHEFVDEIKFYKSKWNSSQSHDLKVVCSCLLPGVKLLNTSSDY